MISTRIKADDIKHWTVFVIIMAIILVAIFAFAKHRGGQIRQVQNERAELASRSEAHTLLVPAFFDCRRDSFFEKAPSVGTCLGQIAGLALALDLSAEFPTIKTDILAYEAVSQ